MIQKDKKILLLCEGSSDKTIIDLLLDNNKLIITYDDLIDMTAFNARQLTVPVVVDAINRYANKFVIYRICDSQKENLDIPKEFKEYVSQDDIYDFRTRPEMEMLIIINENRKILNFVKDYKKSKMKPSVFVKSRMKFNKHKYNKDGDSLIKYFGGDNIDNLVYSAIEYKRTMNKKNELCIADLLKKED